MDDICLLICDTRSLEVFQEKALMCLKLLQSQTNDQNENEFIEKVLSEKEQIKADLIRSKSFAWDFLYEKHGSVLICEDNKAKHMHALIESPMFKVIVDNRTKKNELENKIKLFEDTYDEAHEILKDVSKFLSRDNCDLYGITFAIIPDICNIRIQESYKMKRGRQFNMRAILEKVVEYLSVLIVEKKQELATAKSRHFDSIFDIYLKDFGYGLD